MISIANGLRISATNLDALRSGAIVGAFSKTFLAIDRSFALYPDLQTENSNLVTVDLWAECKNCESIDNTFDLLKLSQLTALPIEELESIFQQRASIFLVVLRVYKLSNPIQVQQQSTGNFVPLPESITIFEKIPILDDEQFQQIQDQSKDLELSIISSQFPDIALDDEDFLRINSNILSAETQEVIDEENQINDSLSWIKTISKLGDRSIETDTGKNNWEAGTDFENIAKQGLEFLGFTIDESHKGGAGGLDLFCSKPYPLTGECKAGKSVPSRTTEELLKLGGMRLGIDKFLESKKLIIGAGKVSNDVITASHEWKVSIIKAMTLQKLVELKAKYDGAVNLFELKQYMQAGQIDDKIHEYIQKVESDIKLRSHVVQTVKNFLLNNSFKEVETNVIFGLYAGSNPPKSLSTEELKEILIELSSPLAGYLGRVEEKGKKCDRFYYLRDLPT
ncbi:MAG: DUF1802 family protein [Pseudanabaena sp. M135S2SP2A07QC]|uniref:DUF1802 family protein n=1 Tax=Microcystis sp. M158S2 TaxID=2771152 RepID=UPI002588AC72|nr:DUF1802 family protein [Microcystis sp. M158S2]MCA6531961.1 DUF1802 family protein [Pseudanabaena sp. M125S2SP2A07QC]MCA6535257.1 DUF1802 family protein [Pseudanabaena sp. M176S2SP2A07QC]MCA6538638.1 DUF1802 family protein [Pseudanabaena sp. M037S2SP2A07QC]MCA6550295.1 DUF1802 family protein [Pseudanabaena sp. M152S2SP2A07QC]MCA6554490.1 DUF1802 family protein [Pseudanabaena sp. M135S2SP2A07QC]MCA6565932.1 DUF1802 family protein [Pseudanabaena sp. M151S2SP2A07QC]MCA6569583.1 DUF1802 famil